MLLFESLEASRLLARESCVLLKNEAKALPLRGNPRIALIGQLADVQRDLNGSWQGQSHEKDAVSVRTALEKAYPGRISYAQGAKTLGNDRSGFKAAIATAKKSDVIVAALGEGWYMSGEASSRSELGLPGVRHSNQARMAHKATKLNGNRIYR